MTGQRARTRFLVANPGVDPSGGCWPKQRLADDLACPNRANHVYGPGDYVAWHCWADEMKRAGYKQAQCECGYWMLVNTDD